jgi:nicotinamidase-related amidase
VKTIAGEEPQMLDSNRTALILVDLQTKVFNSLFEKEALSLSLQKLVKGARVLDVPIVVSEQNPRGLGSTISEIANLLPGNSPIIKVTWSCCGQEGFRKVLEGMNRRQLLLAGCETHVCVYQTAMDLLSLGYEVQMVADCVGSRTAKNRDIALSRLVKEGARLTSAEMALFELLRTEEGPRFKEILKIVK